MKASKNATVAKARAVYGKRLKENDYMELASKKKVSEAAEYLKHSTHFSDALANIDTSSVHRGFLESLLNKAYYDQYERLCKFQHLNDEPFYNFLLVRFEIRELLKAILYLNNDSEDVYIGSMHAYLLKKASFDLIALAKASDFKQLLEVIRHTPYYNILKNIQTDKNGNIPYTKCEVMLRTYYLKWLIETAEKSFHGKSKSALLDQIYAQTDIINIINAYRMKKYFYADGETLKENMLPFYGELSRDKQTQLFETATPEEFLRMLSKNRYGRRMENLDENMDSETFERELVKLKCNMARQALMFSDNAAVSLYSLMYLSEVELNNIIKIVESIRYNKSISYMEKLIIIQ
ncbi:V-type ATPase subunit [Porcipelethomonas sp.]|uniref:V-type ATPase subunit n=1 Tax=Porcipelethomonas sp. TaxID=2981675 RepID=UPI003EF5A0F0